MNNNLNSGSGFGSGIQNQSQNQPQSNSNSMFIRLFYSVKCEESMNLWQVIYNEGIGRMFIPVCLDQYSSKQLQNINVGIEKIPSIVISTQNHQPVIYEGPQNCSKWLTGFTINRRRCLAQQIDAQRRLIQKEHAKIRNIEGGPIEYSEAEMDGVSDVYAYTDTDLCQPKNYVMVGSEESHIVTPINQRDCKIDDKTLHNYINELKKSRELDSTQIASDMEKRQIADVINRSFNSW